MRAFEKGLPYYFPLTEHTIRHLFFNLFSPFAHGQSSTFLVKRGFGGGRALVKFMLRETETLATELNIPVSCDTHAYVYVDPDLAVGATAEKYEKLLLEEISEVLFLAEVPTKLTSLPQNLWKQIEKKDLVFILAGMSYLQFCDVHLWKKIRSLLVYPEKVHFLFVLYDGGPLTIDSECFRPVRDLMYQNVIRFDTLARADIEYSIERWAWTLECEFNETERKEIVAVSKGSPKLLKICCFAMAEMKRKKLRKRLSDHPAVVGIERIDVPIFLKDDGWYRAAIGLFSKIEYEVFMKLLAADGEIVSRDDIAWIMWGGDISKYSDEALTQLIKRIRRKIEEVGAQQIDVKTVYGRGYKVVREDTGPVPYSIDNSTPNPLS